MSVAKICKLLGACISFKKTVEEKPEWEPKSPDEAELWVDECDCDIPESEGACAQHWSSNSK